MIPCVRVKEGVLFTVISPAGFHILSALDMVARQSGHDLTITSGTDGTHSGPDDPHKHGSAYDIRTHDLADKEFILGRIKMVLGDAFFAFLEDPEGDNEHIHCQLRKGMTYP
jgi:hypothetical protein